jgi:hypothetical protein
MNAELFEIWRRYKPECRRGASFWRNSVIGCMDRVPIAAGVEAMDTVRRYYTEALMRLQTRENAK